MEDKISSGNLQRKEEKERTTKLMFDIIVVFWFFISEKPKANLHFV